ncbi:MAG: DUF2318 domain-containing protein [Deltaproteobacteria bacterium]|nr:DUF2318 domain-containing protein [Deltaproteobacteria bacterium]
MKEKRAVETSDKRSRKREIVTGNDRKRSLKAVLIGAAIVILGLGVLAYGALRTKGAGSPAENTSGTVEGATVTHPVALFDDGRAKHFEFEHENTTVRYFVLKSSDGVVRAAFDACDVCWPAGRGYFQEGDMMVCRNCGRRFASIKVNEVKGGCNPAPLTRGVQGDRLVIRVSDLLSGKPYFDFTKKG